MRLLRDMTNAPLTILGISNNSLEDVLGLAIKGESVKRPLQLLRCKAKILPYDSSGQVAWPQLFFRDIQ